MVTVDESLDYVRRVKLNSYRVRNCLVNQKKNVRSKVFQLVVCIENRDFASLLNLVVNDKNDIAVMLVGFRKDSTYP